MISDSEKQIDSVNSSENIVEINNTNEIFFSLKNIRQQRRNKILTARALHNKSNVHDKQNEESKLGQQNNNNNNNNIQQSKTILCKSGSTNKKINQNSVVLLPQNSTCIDQQPSTSGISKEHPTQDQPKFNKKIPQNNSQENHLRKDSLNSNSTQNPENNKALKIVAYHIQHKDFTAELKSKLGHINFTFNQVNSNTTYINTNS